jgi:hypothetical protein
MPDDNSLFDTVFSTPQAPSVLSPVAQAPALAPNPTQSSTNAIVSSNKLTGTPTPTQEKAPPQQPQGPNAGQVALSTGEGAVGGAGIGTDIMPGIGTAIGGAVGAVGGFLSKIFSSDERGKKNIKRTKITFLKQLEGKQ